MKPASIFLGVLLSWVTKTVKPINAVRETATGSRSPAGPRRLGTATRISASLSRRLSAFFGSTHDQAPKAAKYAVLTPGPGMFVNVRNVPRVVIAPPSETPPVSACKPLCAIFRRKPSVYPLSPVKANVAVCAGGVEVRMTDASETLVWLRFLRFLQLFRGRKRKQDKGLASEPTLCPITSARSAGS